MHPKTLPVQATHTNQAATTSIESSGVMALGSFIILFQLALLIILARRQARQRSTKAQLTHLERSWQLKPWHHTHYN